jgi:hypothetical protein
MVRTPNKTEKAMAMAKFGKYSQFALHASAGTWPFNPGLAYALFPGVQVCAGRSSDSDSENGVISGLE